DNAEKALQAVDSQPVREIPVVSPAPSEKQFTGTMVLGQAGQAPQPTAPPVPPVAPVAPPARGKPAVADAGDPELLALFLEEAREEEGRTAKNLPAWARDPPQRDARGAARRPSHPWRGSGRVVGATARAGFAWSIENLLTRLRDK